jgi:hypothetical protein
VQDDAITPCCYDTVAGKDVKCLSILIAALLAPTFFCITRTRKCLIYIVIYYALFS